MRLSHLLVVISVLGLVAACVEPRWVGTLNRCGNGRCEPMENPTTCPEDCLLHTCGNQVCEAGEPTQCPADCPPTVCGNGNCEPGEDPLRCEADCPWGKCGNRACEPFESPAYCPEDCFPGLCGNALCEDFETHTTCPVDCLATRAVDVLFVVDNSGSMAEEQARLRQDFPALLQAVRSSFGGAPDLHVGVISTDLGTQPYPITYCDDSGDEGRLVSGPGANLSGAPYLVDVAPQGCQMSRDAYGACTQHDCLPEHCSHQAATQLATDEVDQCPRCRNFPGTLEDTFTSQANLGIVGCGFEQPLESMYRALGGQPANEGFLRQRAILAVVVLSDEDDCSARDPELFDNTQTDMESFFGPLTSFRCFEFGVTCDVNNRTHTGIRTQCTPREDPSAKLHPLSRYVNLLRTLKDPGQVVVAVLSGPVAGDQVEVGLDEYGQPKLMPSCESTMGGADPAIRLRAFADHFNDAWALSVFGHQSICEPTYVAPLTGLGVTIKTRLKY